ncbi:LPS translocon maturation chaperone LptM [Vibrio pectenicida]
MKKLLVALFVLTVLGLTACGQTGPLYMPEDVPHNEQPSQQ